MSYIKLCVQRKIVLDLSFTQIKEAITYSYKIKYVLKTL